MILTAINRIVMKTNEKKYEFIMLRAQGLSHDAISQKLRIAKGTSVKWSHELDAEISKLKRESLDELYESYGMHKTARIQALGDTLKKINAAIEQADFSEVPLSQLLKMKLLYQSALKDEYTVFSDVADITTIDDIKTALNGILYRVRDGEISDTQLQHELTALKALQTALHDAEIVEKIDELERIMRNETN